MRTSAVSSGMELLSRRVSRRLSGRKVFSILVAAMGAVHAATWTALTGEHAPGDPARLQRNSGGPGQEGALEAAARPSTAGEQAAQAPTITPDIPGSPLVAVATYIITLQDVSGPFTKFPRVRGRDAGQRQILREAKLPRL